MDVVIQALAKKKTKWKEDLYFAVMFAQQKQFNYYAEVTPTTGMLLISAHILDPLWKPRLFRRWDKGMDINPENETFYTTQYHKAFLKYVENDYCAKQLYLPIIKPQSVRSNNLISSWMASRFGLSSYDPYD